MRIFSKGNAMDYDFSGYATKNDLQCADGRVIRHDAFKENDGTVVPLVWQHVHDNPTNVLGHALLENRDDGVYAYGKFNGTPSGIHAKEMVENGDICSMSIYANRLKQNGNDVVHGTIREVSLVLAGANPGALIDNISFAHGDGEYTEVDDEAVIFSGIEGFDNFEHSDEEDDMPNNERTVKDVIDSMTEEQKKVLYFLVAQAAKDDLDDDMDDEIEHSDTDEDDEDAEEFDGNLDPDDVEAIYDEFSDEQKAAVDYIVEQVLTDQGDLEHSDNEGGTFMKHNIFDGSVEENQDTLSHDELNAILADATRTSSLKETFLEHGVQSLDVLFPEAKMARPTPDMLMRDQGWVTEF